jgi:hypothetical protein
MSESQPETLANFLQNEAKFNIPIDDSNQTSTTSVKEEELAMLPPEWKAMDAYHDPDLANALIQTLRDYIEDRGIIGQIEHLRRKIATFNDDLLAENIITNEAEVSVSLSLD